MKRRKKEQTGGAAAAVQVRERGGHPFAALRGYMPLGGADAALYRSVREAVPIVDAAIGKLVRLSGGFRVLCEDERAQEELGEFLRTVNVGHAQVGFNAFLDKYLDSLLTNGRAVGEIVPDAEGREIAAVLCHRVEQLALREGETALDVRFCGYDAAGRLRELPRQELVLFTPLLPESENPYGVSLLRSMPFMAELLSRIYYAVGQNWERCGNVRFAVVYKPQGEEPDGALARERAELLAQEWSGAMQETRGGSVRDFVSVGDVSIRAIGADNVMPDCEVLFIGFDHVVRHCERACDHHNRLVNNLFRISAEKAQSLSKRISLLSQRSMRQKLTLYLEYLSAEKHSARFELPMQLSELAGYLSVERQGRHNLYRPLVSEANYRRWANRSFLGKMYQSSLRRMVASLVESRDLTDRDLAELEEFIAGQRRAREEERS